MTQEETFGALKMGYNVFLTGPAGSGKTFLLQKYIRYLRQILTMCHLALNLQNFIPTI